MRIRQLVILSLCLVSAGAALLRFNSSLTNRHTQRAGVNALANTRIVEAYGKLPLSFEANHGQTDSEVKFLSRGNGYSLFLTSTEAVLALNQSPAREQGINPSRDSSPSVQSAPRVYQ